MQSNVVLDSSSVENHSNETKLLVTGTRQGAIWYHLHGKQLV